MTPRRLRAAARGLRLLAALVSAVWLVAFAPPAGATVAVVVVLHEPGPGGAG
ncbi:hypothetical protein [Streptomyces chattanoogensis]|uniref:hypothetical protein n=1 Tax=Streptomyces chattanoogensis TaxID=66876 RepID=UPI0036B451EF